MSRDQFPSEQELVRRTIDMHMFDSWCLMNHCESEYRLVLSRDQQVWFYET